MTAVNGAVLTDTQTDTRSLLYAFCYGRDQRFERGQRRVGRIVSED